jgi:hypothetical protein
MDTITFHVKFIDQKINEMNSIMTIRYIGLSDVIPVCS